MSSMVDPMQLPAPCRELLLRHMDGRSRAALRMVSRQAWQAVNEATCAATFEGKPWVAADNQKQPLTRLPAFLAQCPQLQRLTCHHADTLCDVGGLPGGLLALERLPFSEGHVASAGMQWAAGAGAGGLL